MLDNLFLSVLNMSLVSSYVIGFVLLARLILKKAPKIFSYKRLDHITRILGFIALSAHWFNPLVWIAFALSGMDMELSCDEAVMKSMDSDIKADHARIFGDNDSDRKDLKKQERTYAKEYLSKIGRKADIGDYGF